VRVNANLFLHDDICINNGGSGSEVVMGIDFLETSHNKINVKKFDQGYSLIVWNNKEQSVIDEKEIDADDVDKEEEKEKN
jgi:hypothetical protein